MVNNTEGNNMASKGEELLKLRDKINEGWILYGAYIRVSGDDTPIATDLMKIVRKLELEYNELFLEDGEAALRYIKENGGPSGK
jgi:hypothetical protein